MSERIATVEDLVAAREARGLGPDDVMRHLKLAPRQLAALEQGQWSDLPGQAFVRGVLRGYGRMLDVDIEPLIESMSAAVRAADLRPAASLDQPLPRRSMLGFGSGGSGSRVAWVVLLALGVLVLALFFGGADPGGIASWLQRTPADTVATTPAAGGGTPGITTESVPLSTLQSSGGRRLEGGAAGGDAAAAGAAAAGAATAGGAQGGTAAGGSAGGASALGAGAGMSAGTTAGVGAAMGSASATASGAGASGAGAPAAGMPAAGSSAATAPAAAAPAAAASTTTTAAGAASAGAAAAAAPSGTDAASAGRVLRLNFDAESWVEARRDGKVLFSGIQPAGSSRELAIEGSTALVVGNAAKVRAEFDGKPLALAPHLRGTVARFTLP